ncbi:MAG: TMEM14 family protein [Rhabdochlamydiaceae bacterium]|jgi:uncharacterized membrane protein (UPF0136 family)
MFIFIWVYIALLLSGSFIGFYKAGSVMSLVMGVVFTVLLTYFTLQYRKGKIWAGQCLLLTVLALDSFFSWRYLKTHALMPAGVFLVLSSILLVLIYFHTKKRALK